LSAVVLGAVGWSLSHQWRAVHRDLDTVRAGWLVAAGLVGLASVAVTVLSWQEALRAAGAQLPLRPAARVFYVGQLGKYVPGSVWPLLAQMELGRRYAVPRQLMAVGGLLQLALSVLVTGALGLLVLPFVGGLPTWELALVVAAVVGGALVLLPPVLDRLLGLTLRLLRRPPMTVGIGARQTLASIGWAGVAGVGLAAQADLLARGLGADAAGTLLAGGALLLGVALGVLVVPVPAGAGVREATIVLVMHGHLGTAEATALALLSRLLLALADVSLAAAGWAVGRWGRPPAAPTTQAVGDRPIPG
jgi:hypothetical protein